MKPIPSDLPPETREAYQRYLSLPILETSVLLNRIDAYLSVVKNASGENEFLDLSTANSIATALKKLAENSGKDSFPHVQAATYYFVNAEDASPDLESILGFDDDAEVVNAVCRHLGCPELQVEI